MFDIPQEPRIWALQGKYSAISDGIEHTRSDSQFSAQSQVQAVHHIQ
jgi:hypothetical protein